MPLSIIRNDITRVTADAIVNTANPHVAVGRGTDSDIYRAAGKDRLLEARNMIGDIQAGHAAVTPAFGLDAKYIIHTVGPAWKGGAFGERETVAECYRNCLSEAARLECGSVAFPLISTGTYGFPKDEALDIAIREISGFLDSHEMDVILVVYDKESFTLSSALFKDVKSYIDDAEVRTAYGFNEARRYEQSKARTFGSALPSAPDIQGSALPPEVTLRSGSAEPLKEEKSRRGIRSLFNRRGRKEEVFREEKAPYITEDADAADYEAEASEAELSEAFEAAESYSYSAKNPSLWPDGDTGAFYTKKELDDTLAQLINNRDESFQQKLFRMIDERGMTDPEVYKRANIDRKLFSKIRSNVNYNPTKKTAVAFAIALGLNLDQTTDLLRSAGMSLSPSSSFDIIIRYCIEHNITNIHEINCILFEFDQVLLGA